MKVQRALVTGGAGFIGSYIVEKLLDRGIEVTVLDDFSTGRRENLCHSVEILEGDICDPKLVTSLIETVDVVFHQAAKVSIRNSIANFYEDARVNLLGTLNILRAISNTKRVKRLIYASSMAVYGTPKSLPIKETHAKLPSSPYGIAKLASENYCLQIGRQCGFDVVILRYFNTFGMRQTFTPYVGVITIFINRILNNEPPVIFGSGEQRRDFIFVGDVADANMRAMNSGVGSGIFNIGSGKGTSVNKIATMLLDRLNPTMSAEYGPAQPGEPEDSIADISLSAQIIGFQTTATLEQKIDQVINWWKNQRAT